MNGTLSNNKTPRFSWNSVTYGNSYQIQIAKVATFLFLPTMEDAPRTELFYIPDSDLDESVDDCRVRALNASPEPGPWSVIRAFTIDTTPPPAAALSLPADGATPVGIQPSPGCPRWARMPMSCSMPPTVSSAATWSPPPCWLHQLPCTCHARWHPLPLACARPRRVWQWGTWRSVRQVDVPASLPAGARSDRPGQRC